MSATAPTPDVSVIIPAYGRPAFLRELLHSLLASDAVPLEMIVIDDGSPEPIAAALADEFTGTPVHFVHQTNAGVAAARNAGASLARGEFLMFVDDDDLVPAGSLTWRVDFLRAHPGVTGVAGRCAFIRDGQIIDVEPARWRGALTPWDLLMQNRFYSPGQVLFRRSAFERTAGCRRDCLGSDDWALWIDLAQIGPLHCDERIGLLYRLHTANFSRNIAIMADGAERVVDAAAASLCSHHAAIGNSLATDFIHAVYAPKLAAASRQARGAGEWSRLLPITAAQLRLDTRRMATRVSRKLALVRHFRRWRMSSDELLALGRHCSACRRAQRDTPASTAHFDPVRLPA